MIFQDDDNDDLEYLKTPSLLRILKIIRIFRVIKLLRVLRLKKLLYKVQEYVVTDTLNTLVEVFKIILFMFVMSHWMACAFYYVADF